MNPSPEFIAGCWVGFALYTFGALVESLRPRWWAIPILLTLAMVFWPVFLGALHARKWRGWDNAQ